MHFPAQESLNWESQVKPEGFLGQFSVGSEESQDVTEGVPILRFKSVEMGFMYWM